MTDIHRIFLQEQRSLREEGLAFSTDFPEAARLLDTERLEDRDPYVERLVEGNAFLAARIRETLENEEDGLTQNLLELVAPDVQQPLPSVCVTEFHPRKYYPSEFILDAGSEIRSRPIQTLSTPCRFTLTHPVPIRSVEITLAKLHLSEDGSTPLELELTAMSSLARGNWSERIPFYLHGDPAVVWAMRFALLRRISHIQILRDNVWENARFLSFLRLDQPGYAPPASNPGPFSDARDFFCVDERFKFVQLVGADAEGLSVQAPLRVRIHFTGALPRGMSRAVVPTLFRLNSGVVINRFSELCQSIAWDHTSSDHPVNPQTGSQREILDITSVQGLSAGHNPRRTIYHRYSAYRSHGQQCHYQVIRRRRKDGQHGVSLSLGGYKPDQELLNQYLAIEADCSDGSVPHDALQPADLSASGPGVPENITKSGLTRPSITFRPPTGSDPRSRLLAFAAGHFDGWLDATRLKDGLRQMLWDPSESKRTLIDAIQDVRTESGHVLEKGVAWREMRTTIRLRDTTATPDTWERLGVIDAFGRVLLEIVRDATPIGSRTRLTLQIEPSGVVLEWTPPK